MTLFLAQIYGPILFAIGLGVFLSRSYYTRIYHDLQKETLAVLIFGMVATAAGIVQIGAHNEWGTFIEGLVSAIGWGMLIKGLAFIIIPGAVDRGGDWTADSKLLPMVGFITLLIGGYLSWFAYLA